MTDLYVIMRDIGEYDERSITPIRWVSTEAEAVAACARATEEGQSGRAKPPYPDCKPSHGWQLPDGSWCEGDGWNRPATAAFRKRPDGDELEAAREAAHAAYGLACLAMGCVDPWGPEPKAEYVYEVIHAMPDTPSSPATP